MASPAYKLDTTDVKKIGKGALVAMAGAVVAYVTTVGFPEMDKAALTAFLSAVAAVAVNAALKFVKNNTAEVVEAVVKETEDGSAQ